VHITVLSFQLFRFEVIGERGFSHCAPWRMQWGKFPTIPI